MCVCVFDKTSQRIEQVRCANQNVMEYLFNKRYIQLCHIE